MSDFVCWDPEEGDAEEAGITIKAGNAGSAAVTFIERDWEGEEYPQHVDVQDQNGNVTHWTVVARPTVDFCATRREAKAAS